jgi:putative NADH-flavin reductase
MKIAVIGITGKIGAHIAAEAVARGHHVVGIARRTGAGASGDAETLPLALAAPGQAEIRPLDIFDPDALLAALRGCDAVVSAFAAPADAPVRVADAAHALIAAARAAAIRRLIVVGGAGSLEVSSGVRLADTPGFPERLKPKADAHGQALAALRAAPDLDWTCVSPAAEIGPGEQTGNFRWDIDRLVQDSAGHSRISYRDFAGALLDEIESTAHLRQFATVGY